MRTTITACTALLVSAIAAPIYAGGNDLFEAKTATAAINETAKDVLSNRNRFERKAKKLATKADRRTLKAYTKCPEKARRAERLLARGADKLAQFTYKLAYASGDNDELDALADFASATLYNIDTLLASGDICDKGTTLTQAEDIQFSIDPAPFVNFATGWGTLFSSAHGTFGDFAPESAAPDHVHSGTYYGVVIKGVIKNPFGETPNGDLATAKPLPAGSFWSVPANAIHTTACAAGPENNCLFYFHSRDAFDFDTDISEGNPNNESAQEISFDEIALELAKPEAVISPFARMYTLWGDRNAGPHGTIGEFIPGGASPLHTHTYTYHGVVLSGTMVNPFFGQPIDEARQLEAGDYWFVPAGVDHVTACVSEDPCTFYFHSEGMFDFLPPTDD